MNKKFLAFFLCLSLTACISAEERLAANYRYDEALHNQCSYNLRFSPGTQNYMTCRMFFDDYFTTMGDTKWMSYSAVQKIQNKINAINGKCAGYWGQNGDGGSNLWPCIQYFGKRDMDEARRKKELEEQERIMRDAVADGQREAYEDARVQARIDEERARVAAATGKNPKKIYCTSSTKSNGYIKVKCK